MICVSIAEPTLEDCLAAIQGLELAEIRIDKTSLTAVDVKQLFSSPSKLVATCRPGGRSEDERLGLLQAAFREAVLAAAREKGCRVIISYHNDKETPLKQVLLLVIEECFDLGADIAKVVCCVQTPQDCVRLLSLYETRKNVVALGMGKLGVITRIAAPFLGAPLTYASLAPGHETAEGQPDIKTMEAVMKFLGHG
jgi:3-dehydroquinate dehydratase